MSGPGAEGARGLPPLAALKPGDAFPPLEMIEIGRASCRERV